MSQDPSLPSIAFAGLGIMGSRMATRLLQAGHPLTVWNRSSPPLALLVEQGAQAASSPRAAAALADLACTCLADPQAVRTVVLGEEGILAGLRPGSALVDFSTGSPDLARELERACQSRGVDFLEAPVTGSRVGAAEGTLLLMCGGTEAAFTRLAPVLQIVGKKALHIGPAGQAATVKLIGNTLISFMLEGLVEGLALGIRAGIPPEKILEVVQSSGFASPYWSFKGGAMIRRDWDTHFSLDLLHKDQGLALAEGKRWGVPMPGLQAIRGVVELARERGWGGQDIAALFRVIGEAEAETRSETVT